MSVVETELVFEDAVPVETPNYAGPQDAAPETEDVLSCEVCGKTLTYAGRGRKPKFCDEHKKGSAKPSGGAKTRVTGNEKLAEQAVNALVQINNLTGFGARLIGMEATAGAIDFCQDGFREQAYAALVTDPALCRQILSAGEISGKFSLAIAYAMMGAMVAPVAAKEIQEKRAERAEKREAAAAGSEV